MDIAGGEGGERGLEDCAADIAGEELRRRDPRVSGGTSRLWDRMSRCLFGMLQVGLLNTNGIH